MNRVRIGITLIAASLLLAVVAGVTAAAGGPWLATVGVAAGAEVVFWVGVLLLGHSTYKAARAQGWRRVPGELWRLFRDPAAGRTGATQPGPR